MPKKPKPDQLHERTVSRRSLLEWLGRGSVLALGASLASCLGDVDLRGDSGVSSPDAGGGRDGGPSDSGSDPGGDDPGRGDYGPGDYPFEPGQPEDPVFLQWGERTVDRQDLEQILRSWELRVDGMVEQAKTYSFADLVDLPRSDMLVDFHCVEGWSIYDVPWSGLHLSEIFDEVRPHAAASHVTFHTVGGKYNESLPIEVALEPRTLLAYGIAGNTLPLKHGFPLRIVIPRLLAYKNAKYVERIELTDKELYGFWVAAGYSYDGEVPEGRLRPGRY